MNSEEILREYITFEDVNQSETIEILPLTIIDAMDEYVIQFKENMANEIQSLIDGYNYKIDELYKHYKDESSLLKLEQINIFEYLIVSNVIPNLKKLIKKED